MYVYLFIYLYKSIVTLTNQPTQSSSPSFSWAVPSLNSYDSLVYSKKNYSLNDPSTITLNYHESHLYFNLLLLQNQTNLSIKYTQNHNLKRTEQQYQFQFIKRLLDQCQSYPIFHFLFHDRDLRINLTASERTALLGLISIFTIYYVFTCAFDLAYT